MPWDMSSIISFRLVQVIKDVAQALVPALIIYISFSVVTRNSLASITDSTTVLSETLSGEIQTMLVQEAESTFAPALRDAETFFQLEHAWLNVTNIASKNVDPKVTTLDSILSTYGQARGFATLISNDWYDAVGIMTLNPSNVTPSGYETQYAVWQRMSINIITMAFEPSLYLASEARFNDTHMTLSIQLADQTSLYPWTPAWSGQRKNYNRLAFHEFGSEPDPEGYKGIPLPKFQNRTIWNTDGSFSPETGNNNFIGTLIVPCAGDSFLQLMVGLNTWSVSKKLNDTLGISQSPESRDRLFIFFHTSHGHLMAASHGKYYSHSGVDFSRINSILEGVPLEQEQWDATQATDPFIRAAGEYLLEVYGNWMQVPELRADVTLAGYRYWLATKYIQQSNLRLVVVLLKDRQSVVGEIEDITAAALQSVSNNRKYSYIILAVVAAVSFLLAILFSFVLARHLTRLAKGMDKIAQLEFDPKNSELSQFSEIRRCQESYNSMERGLHVFQKYVPRNVVRDLMSGRMKIQDPMASRVCTMYFADIEGFTTICEQIDVKTLAEVCGNYFEICCDIIAEQNGTIDKFIGDCIMALWNAPAEQEHHQRDACKAALLVQDRMHQLHYVWRMSGYPLLRVRTGIHTGHVLLGNFGSIRHRVAYTVLGDHVNLASRLEALNKKFGTYICVSETTQAECAGDFEFRKLSQVTVPGKEEVVPIYELICFADDPGSPPTDHCSVAEQITYHWELEDRKAVLAHRDKYEMAYNMLVSGAAWEADTILKGPFLPEDTAWNLLQETCKSALSRSPGSPKWDGVRRFTMKD